MTHGSFHNVQAVLDFLPTNLDGLNILDLGLGCGQVIFTIFSYSGKEWVHFSGYPNVLGVDVDYDCLNFAENFMDSFYNWVLKYDILNFPYPDYIIKNVNLVICTEVLEHLTDKNNALKLLKYLYDLHVNIIITVPNGKNLWNHYDKEHYYFNHNIFFDRKDFKNIGYETRLVSGYDRKLFYFPSLIAKTVDKIFKGYSSINGSIIATKKW